MSPSIRPIASSDTTWHSCDDPRNEAAVTDHRNHKTSPILIVGAGLSGAVLARELAEAGHTIHVNEKRDHIAGNCHTERDADTGVLVHSYGPHIFHTDNEEVWAYVNRFAVFRPFKNKVKTLSQGRVYSLPVNLHTINQFYGTTHGPDDARAMIDTLTVPNDAPAHSFEDQALRKVGPDLYEAFFKGYTLKQWGQDPKTLPASVFSRLPLRFTYNDDYFAHKYQAMPENGYTEMVAAILDHPSISVTLGSSINRTAALADDRYQHVFTSAPLDSWFDHAKGRLGYRTLDFERFTYDGDYQGCAVMNYGDRDVPYTRITEHKHFAPWEDHDRSVLFRETPRACGKDDIPYYPIRLVEEKAILSDYVALAEAEDRVTFAGRLGTYRYLDMDVTIKEALTTARHYLAHGTAPAFVHPPL